MTDFIDGEDLPESKAWCHQRGEDIPSFQCIKGDGGAVGLSNNPTALRRWMIARPEVARDIEELKHGHQHWETREHTYFAKDIRALVSVMEELSNPFDKESIDSFVLDK